MEIAKRKAELLAFLRDRERDRFLGPTPIVRRSAESLIPLSFAQERLWFLQQLEPGSVVYNICRAARLTGRLDVAALRASLREIVRRHEVLRSAFRVVDDRPVQIVMPAPDFELSFFDLRAIPYAARNEELQHRLSVEAKRPFDFSVGLFLRGTLLRTGDDEHVLILTTHHIAADAWSMGILRRELSAFYASYTSSKPRPFKGLPVQYGDYATWQRAWLCHDVLESQLLYWQNKLKGAAVLDLPTDRRRPGRLTYQGARRALVVPEALTHKLKELSERLGATLYMTLVAAFNVLLYRYTGQEDIVIGSPVANRESVELQGLIGLFVNTLVVRTDLSGNPAFNELVCRVRETCLDAYSHRDLPFEKLVEEIHPERALGRHPLFDVMFVLNNAPWVAPEIPGLMWSRIDVELGTSKFDLTLALVEANGRLEGSIEYRTDLFDEPTVDRLVGHWQKLLTEIVANPDRPISILPLLTDAERHQLLVTWNSTAGDYPKDSSIPELFEAQVERTPHAIAVACEGEQLRFDELNCRANKLAHYLRSLGVGPESLVGICIERSLDMVVSLLGILKAGGAYLPLDPGYPAERLAFMLEDAQCSVVVTQARLLNHVERSVAGGERVFVCLDRDRPVIARQRRNNPATKIVANNLAYVIYTSGSTGIPKGVAIEHKNTVALLHWARSVFTNDEISAILAATSICFDLSVFELFVPLSWGGKVVLVQDAMQLSKLWVANQVTLVNTVPSFIAALLAVSRLPDSLRVVNLAGEPLRTQLVADIYRPGSVKKVYDLYGPSETTTYSTFKLRSKNDPPTIGSPISNTQVFILDSHFQLVPIGVPGELFIGGGGVARGYLNRAELTAEKFINNPFSDDPSSRLFRTGDMGRYLPDGNIEFLGRADNQVKLWGYRIELGEIEMVLNQHPAVKESVVVIREGPKDMDSDRLTSEINCRDFSKRLVAYVIAHRQPMPPPNELRSFLVARLPVHMVPTAYVELAVLPRTPNGKLDRSKLPQPELSENYSDDGMHDPHTEIEELVANVWRDVLQIENVDINDNFFELGGHSLLGVQIVAKLQGAVNKELPLRILFDAPTIAGLAKALVPIVSDGRTSALPPMVPVLREGPLSLSLNQEHLWRLEQTIGTESFNVPYVYHLSGDLNVVALESALSEIIRRHEVLRTVFVEVDNQPVQVIHEVWDFHLTFVDLRGESLEEVSKSAARLVSDERLSPFDLALGPLFRVKLLRLTTSEYLMSVTIHHIICDHWSMQIFRRELCMLYEKFLRNDLLIELPKPTIQHADYAAWERGLIRNHYLDHQFRFWRNQLSEPLERLAFDGESTINAEREFLRESQTIELPDRLMHDFKKFAASENATAFMVLLSVFNVLIHLYTNQRDIRIGTMIANRHRVETGESFGLFANTVVFRTPITPDLTFKEVLKRTREIVLATLANQEVPFEALACELEAEAAIKREDLFQVLLVYNMAPSVTHLTGLTLAVIDTSGVRAKENTTITTFDLIVNFVESPTKLTATVNYRSGLGGKKFRLSLNDRFCSLMEKLLFRSEEPIRADSFDQNYDLGGT